MSIAGDTQPRVPGFNSYSETVLSPRRSGIAWQPATVPGNATLPTATGTNAIAIGSGIANGTNTIVINGNGSGAGAGAVLIGTGSLSNNAAGCIVIGSGGISLANNSIVIGSGSIGSSSSNLVSIGSVSISAATGETYSLGGGTIGLNCSRSILIGRGANGNTIPNNCTDSILIAGDGTIGAAGSIAIGTRAGTEFNGQINICNARFAAANDVATSIISMWMTTTTASPTNLGTYTGGNATTTPTGNIACTNNSTYIFEVDIVAKSASNAGAAAYNLKFAFDRQGSAATSEISALSKTILYTRGTTTGWDVTATADTTNGRPNITVTGAAGTTIRWVGNVKMTKVAH